MIDPLQALLQLGAKTNLFPINSRYLGIETATMVTAEGKMIVYLRRRFVPDPATLVTVGEVQVSDGDRLDRLAATHLGDPIQYWRIADGSGAQVPSALERPGDTLRLTLPAGLGGGISFKSGGGDA